MYYISYVWRQHLRRCVVKNCTSLRRTPMLRDKWSDARRDRGRTQPPNRHQAGRQKGGKGHARSRDGGTGTKAGRRRKGDRSICQDTINAPEHISNNQPKEPQLKFMCVMLSLPLKEHVSPILPALNQHLNASTSLPVGNDSQIGWLPCKTHLEK